MSLEIHALQRIAVTKETSANFATDLTGSATYLDVPFQAGTAQLELIREQLEPNTAQQRIDGYAQSVLGIKSAKLTFTMVLAPHGVAAGNGVTAPAEDDSALLQMLTIAFGGISQSAGLTGGTVSSASSASAITTTGTVTNIVGAGGVVGWSDSNGVHAHFARSASSTSLVLTTALPATPQASDVLYAGATIYPAADPTASFQFVVEGAEQTDRWLLMGGQLTSAPTISRENGQLPTISFTIEFADWAIEPEAAITPATYSNFTPTYVHGEFRMKLGGTGTTTRTLYDVARVEYTLNSPTYLKQTSPSGTNTIARWRRGRSVPFAEIAVSLPFEDATWFTERDDRDYYHIVEQIGLSAGGIVALCFPKCQVWDVQRVDEGGLAYQRVVFRTTNDSYTTNASTNELSRAAMRIGFL